MSNYTKEDKCVGCGAHISEYHYTQCVYDPDFEPLCGDHILPITECGCKP